MKLCSAGDFAFNSRKIAVYRPCYLNIRRIKAKITKPVFARAVFRFLLTKTETGAMKNEARSVLTKVISLCRIRGDFI